MLSTIYLFSGEDAFRKLMPALFVTSVNLIVGLMADAGCGPACKFDRGTPASASAKVTMANASLEGIGSTDGNRVG